MTKLWIGAFVALVIAGALIGVFHHRDASTSAKPRTSAGRSSNAVASFTSWVDGGGDTSDGSMKQAFGFTDSDISDLSGDGDVDVWTHLAENPAGEELMREACNELSIAVGEAPGVHSVTVQYATSKNGCYEWPETNIFHD